LSAIVEFINHSSHLQFRLRNIFAPGKRFFVS
jgi:hypothetical protein